MRKLGEFGIVAKQHDGLRLCAKPANDMEELLRSRGVKPLVHHNIAKLVIELLGDDRAVLSARLAGLERIKLPTTWRLAKRSPIFGASRLPRSFKGRSLSGSAGSSRLDLAWRTRNSAFTAA